MMNNKLKKQLFRFIIAGCCAVGTDCLFYYLLAHYMDLSIAKGISFLIGTIVAYLINKYYTFEQTKKSKTEIAKFFALYISTLFANIGVNKISLILLPIIFKYIPYLDNFEMVKLFAFLCATGTSTILNFIGQKFWVFSDNANCKIFSNKINYLFAAGGIFVILGFVYLEFQDPYYFAQDDTLMQVFPNILYAMKAIFVYHVIPEINPNQWMGTPIMAAGFYQVLNPLMYIAYAISDKILKNEYLTLEVFGIISLLITYTTSYLAAKSLKIDNAISVIFALAFTFSGATLLIGRSLGYFMAVIPWLPLTIVVVQKLREKNIFENQTKWIVLSALLYGFLLFYGGQFQCWVYACTFSILFVLILYLKKEINNAHLLLCSKMLILAVIFTLPLLIPETILLAGMDRKLYKVFTLYDFGLWKIFLPYPLLITKPSTFLDPLEQTNLAYSGSIFTITPLLIIFLLAKSIYNKNINALKNIIESDCFNFFLLGLFAILYSGGLVWKMVNLLPVFHGFDGAFKLLLFINLYWNLAGALILNKLYMKHKTKITVVLLAGVMLIGLNIFNSKSVLFYYINTDPYQDETAVLSTIKSDNKDVRIYPVCPHRTFDVNVANFLCANYNSIYNVQSPIGFDNRVETSLREVEEVKNILWGGRKVENFELNNFTDILREYGVSYYVVAPFDFEKGAVGFDQNIIDIHKRFIQEIKSQSKLAYIEKGIEYRKIDNPLPLAFNSRTLEALPIEISPNDFKVNISNMHANDEIIVNFIWHRGYRYYIDGKKIGKPKSDELNRMKIKLPSSLNAEKVLEIRYSSGWQYSILITIILLLLYFWKYKNLQIETNKDGITQAEEMKLLK